MAIKVKYPSNQGELGYVVNEDEVVDAIVANEDLVEELLDAIIDNSTLLAKLISAINA